MTIQKYLQNSRFEQCTRAFLVTGKPGNESLDEKNRGLLKKNQTGHWVVKDGRVAVGDVLFLLLPSLSSHGYPRELYAGIIIDIAPATSRVNTLFTVDHFDPLDEIASDIKAFLNGNAPPQGNKLLAIWNNDVVVAKTTKATIVADDFEREAFPEGGKRYDMHVRHERSSALVRLAKARRKRDNDGILECEVCNFEFTTFYGPRGEDYIEAHHKVPVSTLKGSTTTYVEDLALVCSNCHRMLHRSPLLSIEELRVIVNQHSTAPEDQNAQP